MKIIACIGCLSCALLLAGCVTGPRAAVPIPRTLQAATQPQKDFVQALAALRVGDSRETVRKTLGEPVMSGDRTWFYQLQEDVIRGGRYVSATLVFEGDRLTGGTVLSGENRRLMRRP